MRELYYRMRRKMCHFSGDEDGVQVWTDKIIPLSTLRTLKVQFDPDVHPEIHVEINNDCNYKCGFCPQSTAPRPVKRMPKDTFNDLLDLLSNIKYKGIVVLSVNNEPFLHPYILEFMKMLSDILPHARCAIYTNGSLITEEHVEFIAQWDYPLHLWIDDYTPDHKIAERLTKWFDLYEMVNSKDIHIKYRSWDEKLSNRGGNQPDEGEPLSCRNLLCTWPYKAMFVRADLKVFLCCGDYSSEVIVGDLSRESIMQVWNGSVLNDIRRKMLATQRRDIPLCAKCDSQYYLLPGSAGNQ